MNTIVFDLGGVIIDLNVPRCVENFKRLMGEENVRNILGIDDEGEGVVAVSAATRQLMHDYEYGNISTDDFLTTLQQYCYEGTTIEQIREAWMSMLAELPQAKLDYIAVRRDTRPCSCLIRIRCIGILSLCNTTSTAISMLSLRHIICILPNRTVKSSTMSCAKRISIASTLFMSMTSLRTAQRENDLPAGEPALLLTNSNQLYHEKHLKPICHSQ